MGLGGWNLRLSALEEGDIGWPELPTERDWVMTMVGVVSDNMK